MLVPYNIDNIKNSVICRVICLSFPFCRNISNGIFFLRHAVLLLCFIICNNKGANLESKIDLHETKSSVLFFELALTGN